MRYSKDLQIVLTVAMSEAKKLRHEYMGLEHLLYALLCDEEVALVVSHAGGDVEQVKRRLKTYLSQELESQASDELFEPMVTVAVHRVLERAGNIAESSGKDRLQGSEVLVALFGEQDAYAVAFLREQGVERLDVVSYLAHGVSKLEGDGEEDWALAGELEEEVLDDEEPSRRNPLARFTQDLVEVARQGHIDPLIGRQREIQRILQILQRRRKNHPILVGDPGVGKTALVEGLAWRICRDDVPAVLQKTPIYRLDMGSLLAGTRYRGDFEERLKGVLKALEKETPAVLFIDEIHTVIGAGSAGGGTLDASNLLKPALATGGLRCIGSTTWKEYRQVFERDQALARRFQKVEVTEPSLDETVKILEGLRSRYEEHHGVRYTRPAVRGAAELASRYLRDRKLPDKAIDLLDEAGAAATLSGRVQIGRGDVESVLATMAQIPARRVQGDDRERLKKLEQELKAVVFGQDRVIEELVRAIKVSRAGLRQAGRPVGCFLLTGPTGVGKTEVSLRLAEVLGVPFLRFDMSEYMEAHTVSRLVGAPPGYVGFDQGGLLTEAVSQSPHAVLLLDEIEKAHPDIFNLLLQVMDHGTLTDTNGKNTDFRHVILLMTSNAGAREMAKSPLGFVPTSDTPPSATINPQAYERLFTPEFRNRLDARLDFQPLSPQVMERIVTKFINELQDQLQEKRVELQLSPAARAHLAKKGYDPAFGARPLARVIDDTLKARLTEEILFGRLRKGGVVLVQMRSGEIQLRFQAHTP